MAQILMIDDDRHLCDTVVDILSAKKHNVEVVYDGLAGLELLCKRHFDLAIVDWNLPRITGIDICKQYRAAGGKIPLLMLTARNELDEKQQGFEFGADDYLTKPFQPKELHLRVFALLRRAGVILDTHIESAGIVLDCAASEAKFGERTIALTPVESTLLEYFMQHPGEPYNILQLMEKVWPDDRELSPEDVGAYLHNLCRKLGEPCPIRRSQGGEHTLVSGRLSS
jgi:two-component system OmpR family response regulator/two-component system response regulator QseB